MAAMTHEDTLQAWMAQESAQAARFQGGAGTGVARPEQAVGLSGLELLQAMLAGRLPAPPIAATMDFLLLEADDGRALFQGTPGPAFLNPMGGLHGGWYATLLHHGRTQHQHRPRHRAQGAARPGRRQGAPRRPPTRHSGRTFVRARRHAVCACDDDLPGVRGAGGEVKRERERTVRPQRVRDRKPWIPATARE
jgi:hypothetical protein